MLALCKHESWHSDLSKISLKVLYYSMHCGWYNANHWVHIVDYLVPHEVSGKIMFLIYHQ